MVGVYLTVVEVTGVWVWMGVGYTLGFVGAGGAGGL